MIESYGEKIKPYLNDAYKAGLDELKKAGAALDNEVEVVGDDIKIPHSLIRQYVEDGVTEPNELVKLIHDDLKVEYPEITERMVRDAISRYGKSVNPTGDEIDKQIRELKSLMQKISQLEDIEQQIRPLKTGLQRDKLSDRQRQLTKQVQEALKTLPQTEEDTARTLKTALDGIKTRLTNEISDLNRQIEAKEKDPKSKGGVEYDQEAKELRDQRDERKKILDEITANPEKDLQEKIDAALKSIEESTKKYEDQARRIKAGLPIELNSTNPLIPDTPALKAAKEAREKARKERDALLKAKPKSPEQIRLDALQKRLDEILQGQVKDVKGKVEDSPEVKALKEQILKAKQQAGLIAAKRTKDEIAIERAEDAIKELDRRIAELDFSVKQKENKAESDELKAVRSLKEQKAKELATLKKKRFLQRRKKKSDLSDFKSN